MRKKHIECPANGYEDLGEYLDYYHSHDWRAVFHEHKGKVGITHECSCGAIRLHANGTIDFHFGCALIVDAS